MLKYYDRVCKLARRIRVNMQIPKEEPKKEIEPNAKQTKSLKELTKQDISKYLQWYKLQ